MENKGHCPGRRKFLKTSALGAAGAVVSGLTPKKTIAGPVDLLAKTAWEDGMQINPAIDNLRVVFCHDSTMVSGDPANWEMEGQNAPVNTEKVQENMDKMAVALAGLEVTDPDDLAANAAAAWTVIFQKPGKEWSAVNVAIKINPSPNNWPRLAVIDKVFRELNKLGVEYGNMTLFDQNPAMLDNFNTAYVKTKIPGDVKVEQHLGGTGTIR